MSDEKPAPPVEKKPAPPPEDAPDVERSPVKYKPGNDIDPPTKNKNDRH